MRYKRRKMNVINKLRNQYNVHKFIRWEPIEAENAIIDCNFGSAGTNVATKTFALANVVNQSEFFALYDQYKILGVRVYFDYSPDFAGASASAGLFPKLWVLRDYDDITTPTLDMLAQSNKTICLRFNATNNTRSIYIRPAIRNEVFRTTGTSGFTNMWNNWLDVTNNDIPHFGLKMIAQGLPSNNMGAITIRFKYYLQFKNTR